MSMTYYAVTDDPNELAHWGIKGMKWGVRRTDAQLGHPRHTGSKKPRSAAYKKAQSKLSSAMKNGIKSVQKKWDTYNSPVNKQIRAEKRYEKQTERALQKARKGKLKYGKLTDDQVFRIRDRLALERQARDLSNEEKTWFKRLRESASQGVISGVGSGIGRAVSERVSRNSVLKTDRLRAEQQNELNTRFEREKEKRDNSLAAIRRRVANATNEEYYKMVAGEGNIPWRPTNTARAEYVARKKAEDKREAYKNEIQKIEDSQAARSRGLRIGSGSSTTRSPRRYTISPEMHSRLRGLHAGTDSSSSARLPADTERLARSERVTGRRGAGRYTLDLDAVSRIRRGRRSGRR